MESNQSLLYAVQRDDWTVSIDLKDSYLQAPIYPDSRKFLRFVINGTVYQFKALCFCLSTAPQVFIRVMALVLVTLHHLGMRILWCLDDWLLLASSWVEALWARETVLAFCRQLGIVLNFDKSYLTPTQTITYLGMVIVSRYLRAFPSPERVPTLLSDHQISVLQTAKLCCLALPVGSPVLPVSCGTRGLPSHAVSPVSRARSLGFGGRFGHALEDSLDRVRPLLRVWHMSSSCGRLIRLLAAGPSVLVRCVGSGVGG